VVVSVAIALAILLFNPPPQPAPIFLTEVAQALQMGSLDTRSGRKLVREVTRVRPPALDRALREGEPFWADPRHNRKHVLELLLHADAGAVALMERPRRPIFLDLETGPGGPPRYFRPPPNHGPGPPFQRPHRPEDEVVFDDFTAAYARPDGAFVIVRPGPWPFPTQWQRTVLISLACAAAFLTVLSFWFSRRLSAPFDRFAEAAERLGRNPVADPIAITGPSEVRRAAQAMNDMQVRIRRYVEDRTGMIGAISHDLRTPLARIRFKLEAKAPDKSSIEADLEQMEEMITKVLAFLRDSHEPQRRDAIDLLSLVETVVDDAASTGAGVIFDSETPPDLAGVTVEGDVASLRRILDNLVTNAIVYGKRAEVRLVRRDKDVVVEIADEGPGLTEAEMQAVFKPFHRTDVARNLNSGGVGLGLAVARSLARAHGGDVVLEARGKGLTACLSLPILTTATTGATTSGPNL
jgi:signal transduction histidine kinase